MHYEGFKLGETSEVDHLLSRNLALRVVIEGASACWVSEGIVRR